MATCYDIVSPYDYVFDLPVGELRAVLTGLVDRHSLATVLKTLEVVCVSKAGERRLPWRGIPAHPWQRWGNIGNSIRNAEQVARRNRL